MVKYVTVRGHKKGKVKFESIGLGLRNAKALKKDIISNKNTKSGSWAKNMRFTIKKISIPNIRKLR